MTRERQFKVNPGKSGHPRFRLRIGRWLMGSILAVMAAVPFANAVEISSGDQGEALILPVFTTLNGFDTLVSVTNTSERRPKAVKVWFRGRNGAGLQALNVYLAGGDAWTAALQAGGPGTTVGLPDGSCAFVDQGSGFEVPESLSFDARVGYAEVFEMALTVDHQSVIENHDCEALAAMWETGVWATDPNDGMEAPSGSLRASASLINVEKGTMYSIVATALQEFSDIPQHEPPGSPRPNLSTVHDAGTDAGATTSRLCYRGTCREDQWARPIDAVSAALSAHEVAGEFVIEEAIDGSSEWVVSFPTMRFYEAGDSLASAPVSLLVSDRQGDAMLNESCDGPQIGTPPPTPFFECRTTYETEYDRSLETVSFNDSAADQGMTVPSGILGISHEAFFPLPERGLPPSGYLRLGFPGVWGNANDGSEYWGMPVIAVALQEYVNGVLIGEDEVPQRANYANAFPTSRKSVVVD